MHLPAEISENVLMGPMTSYSIGGPAKYYAKPAEQEILIRILQWAFDNGVQTFILGGGTNILVSDRGFEGLVVHLKDLDVKPVEINENGECTVGAGTMLTPFVRHLAGRGFSGMEDLIGIPGTVGGALIMNAGAYTQEINQSLIFVDVLTENMRVKRVKKEEIGFQYRSAPGLKGKIVLSSKFRFTPGDPQKLMTRVREVTAMRRDRQPLKWHSCGSVFKRPPGDYAGRLIEAAGLKGTSVGGAEISDKHANFIINRGNASASDVIELIRIAKRRVEEEFSVSLQREVSLIGFKKKEIQDT
ncbi:UDP-N-acetylenolpyruvoylglucosamine reductase [candidate division LCP-89 bacterium B3_LCP]|uniref:UDP-N-acetylenolpyruvoylglucosamine reductase n=1 Tax=candidate division LCP-89 bacterium B3_LCP TaxID=2012998 RepID=A0A532V2P2_UNCL8|nr:MAG: UDP-N-acetylenolpyruvoylglucosamine reductase [candidate division LCP-89 bacterium B3_LCP]